MEDDSKDDDKVTFVVKGVSAKAAQFFKDTVFFDGDYEADVINKVPDMEKRARVLSRILMEYAENHWGPEIMERKEKKYYERKARKQSRMNRQSDLPNSNSDEHIPEP